jgi:Esterase/lipase
MSGQLSAESADLLERLRAMGMRPYEELGGVLRARSVVESGRWMQGERPEIAGVRDVLVDGAAGRLPARVYHPAPGEVLPLVVYLHGGGWVAGSVAVADRPCRALALAGRCVVVSVEYRLAPETPFPGGLHDCYAALGWLAAHAADLGADAGRLVVCGDSAGANLAAATALLARDRGGPAIAHQLLVYPCVARSSPAADVGEGHVLTRASMDWFSGHYLADPAHASDPYATPLTAAHLRDLPPATIVTAEFDPLRAEGEAYAARLKEDGVPVELISWPGVVHGFLWMAGELAAGRELIARLGEVLRERCS